MKITNVEPFIVSAGSRLGFGARGPIITAIASQLFPGRRFGVIYGILSVGNGIGAAGNAGGTGGGGANTAGKATPDLPFDDPLTKQVWGHLPERLPQQMSQYYKEQFMPKYSDLLRQVADVARTLPQRR